MEATAAVTHPQDQCPNLALVMARDVARTCAVLGDQQVSPEVYGRAIPQTSLGSLARHPMRAWSITYALKTFPGRVTWSAELMGKCSACCLPRTRGRDERAGVQMPRPWRFKVLFVFLQMSWARGCGGWFRQRAWDWLKGRESSWPFLFHWALEIRLLFAFQPWVFRDIAWWARIPIWSLDSTLLIMAWSKGGGTETLLPRGDTFSHCSFFRHKYVAACHPHGSCFPKM